MRISDWSSDVCSSDLLFMLRHRNLGAGLSIAGTAGSLAIAIALFLQAMDGGPSAYALGGWPAPFGIILVLDRLAAMMLLLTSLLALAVLCHAVLTGLDRRGWHFHPLFQFQLLGLNRAFLTGELFNLFVFFSSDERLVGQELVSTCSSRGSPYN